MRTITAKLFSIILLASSSHLYADAPSPPQETVNKQAAAFVIARSHELRDQGFILTEASPDLLQTAATDKASIATYVDPCRPRSNERSAWIYMIDGSQQKELLAFVIADCSSNRTTIKAYNVLEHFDQDGNFLVTDVYQNTNKCLSKKDFAEFNFPNTAKYICSQAKE